MICKNCGASVDDNAVFCGNCGSPIVHEEQHVQNAGGFDIQQGVDAAGQSFGAVNINKGIKNKTVPMVAAVAVIGIVIAVFAALAMGGRCEKTVDSFMDAFLETDGEKMYAQSSKTTRGMMIYYIDTLSIADPKAVERETGGNVEKYVDESLEKSYRQSADSFLSYFESYLGSKYTCEYEVKDTEKVDKDDIKKFNDIMSRLTRTSDYNVKAVNVVSIEVTGEGSGSSKPYSRDLTLVLSKEGLKWRVISVTDKDFEFSDFYDIQNYAKYLY